jgi:bifunctional non-homologous end joining protein LigD
MGTKMEKLVQKGIKSKMPVNISPMLCTLLREPFSNKGYIYELKLDGYRIISFVQKSKLVMASRSGLNYTQKYPPLAAALKKLKHDLVIDGEVCVLNEEGHPDFDALQKYNGHNTPIIYYAFDLLWIDGYDIRQLPLIERKEILQSILKFNEVIKYTEHFADGMKLYNAVLKIGMEGIVAKRSDSKYIEGDRSANWYKIPTQVRQEFVIGGWAESDKARSFRSLLFGAYNKKGQFEWIGRSGGGYKEKDMPGILDQLKKLEIKESPFINKVLDTKGAVIHYVKPKLVANFSFATWTKSGRIRKPATFLGFRKDKKPEQVVREVPGE